MKKFLASFAILFTLAMFAGCSLNPTPKTYGSLPGKATFIGMHKRYAEHEDIDLFYRFHRVAYVKPNKALLREKSETMLEILSEFGAPDAVRRPYKSLEGERVKEWVYIDKDRVFQFVAGELVYEGPVTDSEVILMTYGYPNTCIRTMHEPDVVNRSFRYTEYFSRNEKVFLLINDQLQVAQEGS